MQIKNGYPVQTKDGVVYVSYDSTEQEYVATMNGFEGCAKIQANAIALCLATRNETLQGEDED